MPGRPQYRNHRASVAWHKSDSISYWIKVIDDAIIGKVVRLVGNDASLRGTGDQTSLHPCLLNICAALLYYIHGPETP